MKTTVKYVVLKNRDYQLGTSLFQEELDADATYFDQIPDVISYQNHQFKVLTKELSRIYNAAEKDDQQTILVKVLSI